MRLEEALDHHLKEVEDLHKAAVRYVSAINAWKKACQTGEVTH